MPKSGLYRRRTHRAAPFTVAVILGGLAILALLWAVFRFDPRRAGGPR